MMNIGNSKGMSKRRTSSQFISSQNSGGSFGDGESECSVMSSGGCFEKLGDSLGVSSFSSDREAINEQCLLSSQGRATQEVRKSHSVDLYEKMQNKRKLCTAGNSPKTLLSDLSKFSSEETKKTESSPESHKIKKNGLCEDSSFIDTSQRVAEKKDNEISNPMFESALDEYEAAFDICFDDDCQELFDCNIEERAINDPKNPKKDCSSDENISDSSLETFPVVKNCKKLVDDSSNVKKYSERFGKIDGHCNKLINNSICSPIKQNDCTSKKNDGIGQGTLQTSNRMCQKSVPEVFTPTTMTQLLSSPGNITSNESMVQRYCSSPKERQSSKPPSMLQNLSPNLSSPIVRSCDARSSENSVSKIRKRKFPGPAGMLPDIPPGTDLFALKRTEFMNKNIFSDWYYENKICSQEIFEHFEKPPWQNMLKDLATHSDPSLLKRFNIRSAMLKMAADYNK